MKKKDRLFLYFLIVLLCNSYATISAQSIEISFFTMYEMNSKNRIPSSIYVYDDVYLKDKLLFEKRQYISTDIFFQKRSIGGDPGKIKIHFKHIKDIFGNTIDLSSVDDVVVKGKDRLWVRASGVPLMFLGVGLIYIWIPGGHAVMPAGTIGRFKIRYPYYTKYFVSIPITQYDESLAKSKIDEQNDGIVGIYEAVNLNGYKLACVNDEDTYKLIFLSSTKKAINDIWKIGEVKAILQMSAQKGVFKSDEWYLDNKQKQKNVYVMFDGTIMKIIINDNEHSLLGQEYSFLKMYPASNTINHSGEWGGTGFALNSGYIVTNYHVIDGASTIEIFGVKGDFETPYTAKVVASDKNNDLALLKIGDNSFTGFGNIPYKVKTSQSEVGETISVLGYPLTSSMGEEIKLTTGVISSKTGFQGDITLYQISAPIQPGNSGGPLFDSDGNIIGVVNSKHTGAENVGYAIKASYLRNLVESCTSAPVMPANNSLSELSLPEKVKKTKNFIFMIRCK